MHTPDTIKAAVPLLTRRRRFRERLPLNSAHVAPFISSGLARAGSKRGRIVISKIDLGNRKGPSLKCKVGGKHLTLISHHSKLAIHFAEMPHKSRQ